jgi:GNAT superfamily N-acetyltransferase
VWLEFPSDRELDSIASLVNGFWREVIPDERDRPAAELAVAIRDVPEHRTVAVAVALDGDEMIGTAELIFEGIKGRQQDGWLKYLVVRPDHRRRGIGRALLDAIVDRSRGANRKRLTHVLATSHPAAGAFAASAGATAALIDMQNRLPVAGLDPRMLDDWVVRATERATNYSIVTFDGVCPDEWLGAFARVTVVMNDAPHSQSTPDFDITPQQVRESMEAFARQGNVMWTVCARDDTTGEFVGFTERAFGPHRPWLANQGDTAVHPDHRERGLGRWLKAINALRMLDERPDVTHVDTWNAGVNAAMLSINHAMGFRPVAEWQEWELVVV